MYIADINLFNFPIIVAALCTVAFVIMLLIAYLRRKSQPILERTARVVAKRQEIAVYYVTFEFEGGDREEFVLSGPDFGQLVEGDTVAVTSQGAALLHFQRKRQPLRH